MRSRVRYQCKCEPQLILAGQFHPGLVFAMVYIRTPNVPANRSRRLPSQGRLGILISGKTLTDSLRSGKLIESVSRLS